MLKIDFVLQAILAVIIGFNCLRIFCGESKAVFSTFIWVAIIGAYQVISELIFGVITKDKNRAIFLLISVAAIVCLIAIPEDFEVLHLVSLILPVFLGSIYLWYSWLFYKENQLAD